MRPSPNPIANSLAPPQSPLAKAASYINSSLASDAAYPELDSYCRRQYFDRLARLPPPSRLLLARAP